MDRAEALAPAGTLDAMKSWLEETEQPAAKISINNFNHIAPEMIKFIQGKPCDLSKWVNIVGGVHNTAIVYNDEGTLFEVPAIMEQQNTINNSHPSQNVQAIMSQYSQLLASSPIAAVNYLGNAFRNLDTGEAMITEETINKWNIMLAHYGEEPLSTNTGTTNSSDNVLVADADYDDDEEL